MTSFPGIEAVSVGAAALAAAGMAQAGIAAALLRRFVRPPVDDGPGAARPPHAWPAVTLLKPLHGDEPMLEDALATFCTQDYPRFQIVFGVQAHDDPAIAVVERLRARFPALDATLVVDASRHGANRKVDNLINMRPHARHDVVVISDADIHAPPDLLRSVVAPLTDAAVGLSTTLYTGLPASRSFSRLLGAAGINQGFLPGALLGRALGREDCLGAVMAIRTETLDAIGGLGTLSAHLADDAVLGRKVRALGLHVALARAIPATGVVERSFAELYRHELRWGRTVRGQAPVGYPLSIVQAPLAWALIAAAATGLAAWSVVLFAAFWGLRAAIGRDMERTLSGRASTPFWLLPIRDLLSLAVIVASHADGRVAWHGQTLHISARKNQAAKTLRNGTRAADRPRNTIGALRTRP